MVGLGTPGREYQGTRHNVGFAVTEELARRWGLERVRERYRGLLREGRAGAGGPSVALLEPQTYMNDVGRSVGPARGAYRLELDHVLVVHDEIDLPFGEIRTRLGGGHAGHNGLKSLNTGLGTRDYARVRVGVGRPPGRQDAADYVLSDFSSAERKELDILVDRAADVVEAVILEGVEWAQNKYHGS